jgi:homocysteine S-methyltransferase
MPDVRLTDGGLETSLIFHQGIDLPLFAAFPLAQNDEGRAALRAYWEPYLALASETATPFVVDTVTWRANPDWATQLGYGRVALREANVTAAAFAGELALAAGSERASVTGVVGPRGDGYVVGDAMTADRAAEYHSAQVEALTEGGVDQVAGMTLTYPEEAIGLVQAAQAVGVPSLVSFTVETDGRLPSGHTLREAIDLVDERTGQGPVGYLVNCAHPTHFVDALVEGDWLRRITGVRANASTMSHAELDAADQLDGGDPEDLADRYNDLLGRLPALELLGGCCGTDHRHLAAIAGRCLRPRAA